MSLPRHIDAGAVTPQPWRNGGGVTRELLALPAGADWQLRISVADIEADGPFSAFPGVQRWFAVLSGAGVELSIDGTRHRLQPGDAPLHFDGGAVSVCRLLDGPTRDLNLMLRGAAGGLFDARDGEAWRPETVACGLFTAVAGSCHDGDRCTNLGAGTLLWFDVAPTTLCFDAATPADPPVGAPIGWWLAATPAKASA